MYVSIGMVMNSTHARAMLAAMQLRMQPPAMIAFMQAGVAPYVRGRIAARFNSEGDDVTGRWHPLAAETEIIRQRHGYPGAHPINVRTGQMRNYLTSSPGNAISAGGVSQFEYPGAPAAGDLMTKLMTAQGGKANPSTLPRPVLGFNMNDSVALTALVAGYMTT